jgi:hypothetical protein
VGIFFVSRRPVVPEIHDAIRVALLVDPNLVQNANEEASQRTLDVVRATAAQFQPIRFVVRRPRACRIGIVHGPCTRS